MADESRVVMRRPCSGPADELRMVFGITGECDATGAHKHTPTHIAMDHSAAQSVWGPCSGCQYRCDVSFMSPLCGLLFKHVDRGIILAFDRFPYIHWLLITHVNAPIGL